MYFNCRGMGTPHFFDILHHTGIYYSTIMIQSLARLVPPFCFSVSRPYLCRVIVAYFARSLDLIWQNGAVVE